MLDPGLSGLCILGGYCTINCRGTPSLWAIQKSVQKEGGGLKLVGTVVDIPFQKVRTSCGEDVSYVPLTQCGHWVLQYGSDRFVVDCQE